MKKLPVSVSPQARADLADIWEYIADQNPEAADRFIHRIENAIELLSLHPNVGHTRQDLISGDSRFRPVGDFLPTKR